MRRLVPYLKVAAVIGASLILGQIVVSIVIRPAAIRRDMDRIQRGTLTEADAKRLFGKDYPWQIRNAAVPATRPTTTPSR